MSWMRRTSWRSASGPAAFGRRREADDLIRGDVEDAGEIGDQGAVQAQGTALVAGEQRRVHVSRGAGLIETSNVSYTYETAYSRMATMVDGTGATSYTYKPTGTLGAGQVATVDGSLTDDVIAYHDDELGRVVQRTINGTANVLT